ncbi:MAG: HprK-related kinase A [Inhella sp.]
MIERLINIAPFQVRVRSPFDSVAEHLERFYGEHPKTGAQEEFADFEVEILPAKGLRRWWRPQARFLLDGDEPFHPLPAEQAGPLFEWGLNWAVAFRPLGYLVMHAAVLARGNRALLLPGFPGAGKSTLCASLAFHRGWRLFSDELALFEPDRALLWPHPRPISLKNASIARVGAMPGARLGPIYRATRKGDISLAACPPASVAAAHEPARPAWLVFPRFEAGCAPHSEAISRAEAFAKIAEQSFNQTRMGETGFRALCQLLDNAQCHEIRYGSTADGLALIDALCDA